MASTVLPNGIIIPEKFSRDWYADLYHNWQELDNLLGGGTPKDGTLTIQKNGDTVGTFSANQATDETINIEVPTVNDATLTIQKNGTTVDTFTANSSTDKTVNITVPTKTSDLTNDSDFVPSTDLATVATSGNYNDLSNKPTIPTVNNGTLTIQKNGTTVDTFTANSSSDKTVNISVPTKTSDLTNDSGFITEDTTKIPLAGSNQISGSLIPSTDGTVNLGSSSYQWNNAYIKSLIISDSLKAKKYVNFNDNTNIYISGGRGWNLGGQINLVGKDSVTRDDSGNIVTDGGDVVLRCTSNLQGIFDVVLNVNNSIKEPQFSPTHNKINLGTSTNKWKSFNGINPGALSLPNMTYISLDTTGFNVTATTIGTFTPTVDGWAILSITQKNKPFGIWILNVSYRAAFQSVYHDTNYMILALMPVRANVTMNIYCTAGDIDSTRKIDWLRLFPCQGNV